MIAKPDEMMEAGSSESGALGFLPGRGNQKHQAQDRASMLISGLAGNNPHHEDRGHEEGQAGAWCSVQHRWVDFSEPSDHKRLQLVSMAAPSLTTAGSNPAGSRSRKHCGCLYSGASASS